MIATLDFSHSVWSQRLAQVLLAVLVGCVLYLCVQWVWWILEPPMTLAPTTVNTPVDQSRSNQPSISGWHLFGTAQTLAPQQQQKVRINTDLVLSGTIAADTAEGGLAFVEDESGEQQVYASGDTLPGGSVLAEIHPGYILVDANGEQSRVELTEGSSRSPGNAASRRPNALAQRQAKQNGVLGSAISGSQFDWKAIRSGIRVDAAQLAQNVQLLPHMENGQQIGVRINAGRNAQLLRNLGLTSSDVILSVNGRRLNDPTKYPQLVAELSSSKSVTITYRRNGKEQTRAIRLP